ncbi:hypothetical protein HKD37_06G016910 [Glycine soja]
MLLPEDILEEVFGDSSPPQKTIQAILLLYFYGPRAKHNPYAKRHFLHALSELLFALSDLIPDHWLDGPAKRRADALSARAFKTQTSYGHDKRNCALSAPYKNAKNYKLLVRIALGLYYSHNVLVLIRMASRKRKSPASVSQARYDRSKFTSQDAWDRYADNILGRKILPERNVKLFYAEFDELRREHKELTNFSEGNIDVAIVKEFYANLYDPEDKSLKQVRVRGHLIKFDVDALNTILKTPVVIEEGESLPAYSRFANQRPVPEELAAHLCLPGRGFELNADGLPLKILRKNLTTLAQTWSVLSFSNLATTSHTSDITLDMAKLIYGLVMKMDIKLGSLISGQISLIAQHDSSRLGVTSDSLTFESLSPAINLAYIKKNCWNLDDPSVTFQGTRKSRARGSEAPSTLALPTSSPSISAPSTSPLPPPPPAPILPGPSAQSSELSLSMLQSLHQGQLLIMQSLQDVEPQQDQEDDILEASEPTPPESFIFETDSEDLVVLEPYPQPEPKPSAPVLIVKQQVSHNPQKGVILKKCQRSHRAKRAQCA